MQRGNSLGRLNQVLDKIDDPTIKEIVKKVIDVEISYRSTEKKNFPRKKIRNIVDAIHIDQKSNSKK